MRLGSDALVDTQMLGYNECILHIRQMNDAEENLYISQPWATIVVAIRVIRGSNSSCVVVVVSCCVPDL